MWLVVVLARSGVCGQNEQAHDEEKTTTTTTATEKEGRATLIAKRVRKKKKRKKEDNTIHFEKKNTRGVGKREALLRALRRQWGCSAHVFTIISANAQS